MIVVYATKVHKPHLIRSWDAETLGMEDWLSTHWDEFMEGYIDVNPDRMSPGLTTIEVLYGDLQPYCMDCAIAGIDHWGRIDRRSGEFVAGVHLT